MLTNDANVATDLLLNEKDAAKTMAVSRKTLQLWRYSGAGPRFIKLGRGLRCAVRYWQSDINKFLADCAARTTEGAR